MVLGLQPAETPAISAQAVGRLSFADAGIYSVQELYKPVNAAGQYAWLRIRFREK